MKRYLLFVFGILLLAINLQAQKYLAAVQSNTNNLWGFIDETGEYVLPPIYKYAFGFSESGLAPIYDSFEDEIYYINLKGDTVLASTDRYNLIKPEGGNLNLGRMSEGTLVIEMDGKKGVINIDGEILIEPIYDQLTPFMEERSLGCIGNQCFIFTLQGKRDSISCQNIKDFEGFSCGRAKFETEEGNFGFLDRNGKVIIQATYVSAYYFSSHHASVQNADGKWGVIDTTGTWLIDPVYKSLWPFENGGDWTLAIDKFHNKVFLSMDGTYRYVDKYDTYGKVSDNLVCGFVQFESSGKNKKKKEERRHNYGFLNKNGEWAIHPSFNWVRPFKNKFAAVHVGRLWGFIDTYGVWVAKPQFVSARDMEFVKVKELNEDQSLKDDFDICDVVNFLRIIEQLNTQDVSKEAWEAFLDQNYKFVNWLLSFKSDTTNYGLYNKVGQGIGSEQNDSEAALTMLMMFLEEKKADKLEDISSGYSEIIKFIDESNTYNVARLREEWKIKKLSLD